MRPCDDDDDDVLIPDVVDAPESPTGGRGGPLARIPQGTLEGLLDRLDRRALANAASEIALARPSLLAQLFRSVRRYEARRDAQTAAEVMRALRLFVDEYQLMERSASEHLRAVYSIAVDICIKNQTLDLQIRKARQALWFEIEEAAWAHRRRRENHRTATRLVDAGFATVGGAAKGTKTTEGDDDLTRRARTAVVAGVTNRTAEKFDDAAQAFAAASYYQHRTEGADDPAARDAAFRDVREMLASNGLGARELGTFTKAAQKMREKFDQQQSARRSVNDFANAVRGNRA